MRLVDDRQLEHAQEFLNAGRNLSMGPYRRKSIDACVEGKYIQSSQPRVAGYSRQHPDLSS